jgi:hypothetical protein
MHVKRTSTFIYSRGGIKTKADDLDSCTVSENVIYAFGGLFYARMFINSSDDK